MQRQGEPPTYNALPYFPSLVWVKTGRFAWRRVRSPHTFSGTDPGRKRGRFPSLLIQLLKAASSPRTLFLELQGTGLHAEHLWLLAGPTGG